MNTSFKTMMLKLPKNQNLPLKEINKKIVAWNKWHLDGKHFNQRTNIFCISRLFACHRKLKNLLLSTYGLFDMANVLVSFSKSLCTQAITSGSSICRFLPNQRWWLT